MIKPIEKIYDWGLRLILKYNKRSTRNKSTGKIVIISLHKLGDAIFTTAAIKNIIEFHKDKQVILVCFGDTSYIYKLIFNSIEYLILDKSDFYFNVRIGGFKAHRIIKRSHAERIYDITGCITSANLLFNCRAAEIIGMNEERYKVLYDVFSPVSKGPHMSDIYLNAIKPVINISKENYKPNKPLQKSSGYILIHPFAGWSAKEWGIENYIDLAGKLSNQKEVRFAVPPDGLTKSGYETLNKKFVSVVTNTIPELIDCIKGCSLFIGNDSGPVHIANILGKPVFTIYGPTNPSYHQPKSGASAYVIKEIVCSPKVNEKLCFTDGGRKGCPSFECMIQLSVDEVFISVTNFMKKLNFEE